MPVFVADRPADAGRYYDCYEGRISGMKWRSRGVRFVCEGGLGSKSAAGAFPLLLKGQRGHANQLVRQVARATLAAADLTLSTTQADAFRLQ